MYSLPTTSDIEQAFATYTTQAELDLIHDTYLWKNGSITAAFKTLWSLSVEEKKSLWSQLWELKLYITTLYATHSAKLTSTLVNHTLQSELVDIHSIWLQWHSWHYHLLAQVRHDVESIFSHLWFAIEYWDEVVTKYENFESVNIPLSHPATEMHDTYYLTQTDSRNHNLVLRTHTSAMQQKIIKNYGSEFKCIIPGKVYRCESTDVSHDTMFWQLEWMVVWTWISIPDFTWLMQQIFSALFYSDVTVRLRPSYFPFTEPSFEMDISCTPDQPELFKLSKETWWLEIGWAGMIHPNVLREAWVNPDTHSWFAFGMGLTRLAAIKYQIRDIRYFTNSDLRFIQSFA